MVYGLTEEKEALKERVSIEGLLPAATTTASTGH